MTSLTDLSVSHYFVKNLLPGWDKSQIKDHLNILKAVEVLQNYLSQTWTNDVVKDIIRDGMSGILPLEKRSIMWKHASEPQKRYSWWRMVNFTYNLQWNQANTFIIMMSEALTESISPIVSLGLNINTSVMQPVGHKRGAIKQNQTWKTVKLEAYMEERGTGYVCNNDTIQPYDVCLNRERGECHYQLDPFPFNGSVVIYVGRKYVNIRSLCTLFKVNYIYIHIM